MGVGMPAAWSFMLAARKRGLGTAWGRAFHYSREREAAELLGIPYDDVMQAALLPVAYTIGESFIAGSPQAARHDWSTGTRGDSAPQLAVTSPPRRVD